jgi:hypothetical protein
MGLFIPFVACFLLADVFADIFTLEMEAVRISYFR